MSGEVGGCQQASNFCFFSEKAQKVKSILHRRNPPQEESSLHRRNPHRSSSTGRMDSILHRSNPHIRVQALKTSSSALSPFLGSLGPAEEATSSSLLKARRSRSYEICLGFFIYFNYVQRRERRDVDDVVVVRVGSRRHYCGICLGFFFLLPQASERCVAQMTPLLCCSWAGVVGTVRGAPPKNTRGACSA